MAANISYAHIAKKAAGTSEDNDTNPEVIEVPPVAQDTTSDAATKKQTSSKKKTSRKNRKDKKAAKLAAEQAEKAKISESSEAEEPQQPKVFIPAPPPKVNVWHKKSTEVTEEDEANDDQQIKDQSAVALAEVKTNNSVAKENIKKENPTPADAAVMKESTADNRPPQSARKPLVSSSALGSPWKTPQVDVVQVIIIDKQLLLHSFWKS